MIDRAHDLPVTRQAEALNVSRSRVYYPHGGLTSAEAPLIDAENLFRQPGPPQSTVAAAHDRKAP